jgi:hypothetical protein
VGSESRPPIATAAEISAIASWRYLCPLVRSGPHDAADLTFGLPHPNDRSGRIRSSHRRPRPSPEPTAESPAAVSPPSGVT